jgi:hypothetical protein
MPQVTNEPQDFSAESTAGPTELTRPDSCTTARCLWTIWRLIGNSRASVEALAAG